MDWNNVLGAKGRAHIKQKVYTNQSDEEKIEKRPFVSKVRT